MNSLPFRRHLAILVLATALPFIGLTAYAAYTQAIRDAAGAAEKAMLAARSAVVATERTLQRSHDVLAYLAQQPRVLALDAEHCDPIFTAFNGLFPQYTNLLTVRRDGERVCSAVPPTPTAPRKVDPALYLAETLRSRAFTVGQVNRGVFTGRWILIVAQPLAGGAGEPPGVVAMAIDLARLGLAPPSDDLPTGAELRLVDGKGMVIASGRGTPEKPSDIGRSLVATPWPGVLKAGQVGTGRITEADGVERFFWAVPVAGTPWHATVDIPVDVVYAPARQRALLNVSVAVLALAAVAVLAFLLGRAIARPVEAIAAAVRRASDGPALPGNAIAASELASAPTEIRELATQFEAMLDKRACAEQSVRHSEERLQAVIENLAEGLIICDPETQEVRLNRAALLAHGVQDASPAAVERFRATHTLYTLQDERLPLSQWPMACLLRGEHLSGLELRMRRDGSDWERVFAYGGALLRDSAGRPLAFLTVTDITERHRAQAQVSELNLALERRVQERTAQLAAKTHELESFCYSVSHDLKAPLRGIDGYSRLLLEDYGGQLGAEGERFIANVRGATRQMTALIEDLLAYSRQERRTLASTPLEVRRFVAEQLQRQQVELEGVRVVQRMGDECVTADPESLAIALRNLLDNARKFSAHLRQPVITIGSRTQGDRCVLSVGDNGSGFDMRYHDKIFEIFQRLHRAEDYPGTGVGLALVRKAVDRMGGRVWAKSSPGEGATFCIELPLAQPADATAEAQASAQAQAGAAGGRHA